MHGEEESGADLGGGEEGAQRGWGVLFFSAFLLSFDYFLFLFIYFTLLF